MHKKQCTIQLAAAFRLELTNIGHMLRILFIFLHFYLIIFISNYNIQLVFNNSYIFSFETSLKL